VIQLAAGNLSKTVMLQSITVIPGSRDYNETNCPECFPSFLLNDIRSLFYGKANPSILIGSFLVGISPYGPFAKSQQIENNHSPSAI